MKFKTLTELFSQPNTWTKGTWGRRKDGSLIFLQSDLDAACQFCLGGALRYLEDLDPNYPGTQVYKGICRKICKVGDLPSWNDGCHSQNEVLEVVRAVETELGLLKEETKSA